MYAPPRAHHTPLGLLIVTVALVALGCDDARLRIEPIEPQVAFVGEFLSVPITVRGEGAADAILRLERPDVPFASRWIALVQGGTNAAVYWDPQDDHIGVHTVRVTARVGDTSATRAFSVEVVSAREATPVFLAPPVGVAVDIETNPCVSVPIEVRDNDSDEIALRVVAGLPNGATLQAIDDRRATLRWCPSPDQLASAERWTITLGASDGEHAETLTDFDIVLLVEQKPRCVEAGLELPNVRWISPTEGERVVSEVGYTVRIQVDGPELSDDPLLFFTDGRLEQRDRLDIDQLDVARFTRDGEQWVATIPTYRLAYDEQKTLTMLVWAVATGEADGATCSLRAPLRARSFAALGAVEAGVLANCAPCTQSGDCRSGVCLADPAGARCVPACRDAEDCTVGVCGDYSSPEGVVRRGCGLPALACEGVPTCEDDGEDAESDDGRRASGRLCPRATDQVHYSPSASGEVVFQLTATADTRVLLSGDDGALHALASGRALQLSTCGEPGVPLLAALSTAAPSGTEWSVEWQERGTACACPPDPSEPDRLQPPLLDDAPTGVACGADVDTRRLRVAANTRTVLTVTGDDRADLDLELLADDGTIITRANAQGSTESLTFDAREDTALDVRVYSWAAIPDAARATWSLDTTTAPLAACDTDDACDLGELCINARCERTRCVRNDDCPDRASCPRIDLDAAERTCVLTCGSDEDCATDQVCKSFEDGRACAPAGDGPTGSACRSANDCAGAAVCIDWPDGYCAVAACDLDGVCEDGTACGVVEGRAVCLQTCWESDDECTREAVSCGEVFAPNTELAYACLPETR